MFMSTDKCNLLKMDGPGWFRYITIFTSNQHKKKKDHHYQYLDGRGGNGSSHSWFPMLSAKRFDGKFQHTNFHSCGRSLGVSRVKCDFQSRNWRHRSLHCLHFTHVWRSNVRPRWELRTYWRELGQLWARWELGGSLVGARWAEKYWWELGGLRMYCELGGSSVWARWAEKVELS